MNQNQNQEVMNEKLSLCML